MILRHFKMKKKNICKNKGNFLFVLFQLRKEFKINYRSTGLLRTEISLSITNKLVNKLMQYKNVFMFELQKKMYTCVLFE